MAFVGPLIPVVLCLIPFLVAGAISFSLAKKTTSEDGCFHFFATSAFIGILYSIILGRTYQLYQECMAQKLWTAAALNLGFGVFGAMFATIPVLILSWIAYKRMSRTPSDKP
jgi:hypothetical protein